MALSDDLERRIGQRTSKGTKITSELVGRVKADEAGNVIILENNAKVIEEAIGNAIILGLEEVGIDAEKIAAENAPVDTGRLSASITHALDPEEPAVYVGTNVEYALYVHEPVRMPNGKTRPGVPFLRDAVTQNVDRYRAILKKHLENA